MNNFFETITIYHYLFVGLLIFLIGLVGSMLVKKGEEIARDVFGADSIMVGAQVQARAFYEKQGFVKTFISFVGCIAALVLSIVLSWVVSDLIYGSFVRPSLVLSVEEYLDSKTFVSVAEMLDQATEAMPDFIVKMADSRGETQNAEIAKELSTLSKLPSRF